MNNGYIYLRNHNSYINVYKLGRTKILYYRDFNYATGEYIRGKFIFVIKILDNQKYDDIYVENLLQKYFKHYHLQKDGGCEFYNKQIINEIIPLLESTNIKFKVLTEKEIEYELLINNTNKINAINVIKKYYKQYLKNKIIKPRDYQFDIINKACIFFQSNDKGILVEPCGIGKTLIALWIAKQMNYKNILIGVPYLEIKKQWQNIIPKIFNNNENIIITTYTSSVNYLKQEFDIIILDECHHLTTTNMDNYNKETNTYIQILKIKCKKQLALTATLKEVEDLSNNVISNNNNKYFGDIIDRRCLSWAIKNNIICDYELLTLLCKDIYNKDMLYVSAYSALQSITNNYSHHILIYSNNTTNAKKIIKYIEELLTNKVFIIDDLYYSNYNSELSNK